MSKKKTTEEFKKELQQIYNGSVELLSEYTGNKNKVTVRFLDCGHIEQKTPTKLLVGQGCGFCKGKAISNSKTKTTEEFKQDLLARNLNHIVLKSDYSGCKKKLKVLNTNCNHTYEAIPSNILRGIGCPICHGFKTSDTFRQQIEEKYPNEYKILGEYINNRTKILVRHKCGYEWEVIPKDLLRDIRCPRCIMSKGELFIFNYLTERKIEFTPQYSFNDCRDILPLPFDFMININGELRLIEFDGQQHNKNDRGVYHTSKVLQHDKIKNDYCAEHNIPLLRIPYSWLRYPKITKALDEFIK